MTQGVITACFDSGLKAIDLKYITYNLSLVKLDSLKHKFNNTILFLVCFIVDPWVFSVIK